MIDIRRERAGDIPAIRALVEAAFNGAEHSSGTEGAIVDALRAAGALTISLVAVEADDLLGHIAFSPVSVEGGDAGWFGLGPLAVRPGRQRQGIGGMLVRAGLEALDRAGAAGCVVLGDPSYYRRFGFRAEPGLRYPGAPPEYFLAVSLRGEIPRGDASYNPAFDAT